MKKIFESRIFLIIITAIITASVVGVSATILYNADEVGFTPTDPNWNVNNLEDALNDLYTNQQSGSSANISNKFYWSFGYTGSKQEFNIPVTGVYKIEVWGASGGSAKTKTGGAGGYSVGYVNLSENNRIYIYVGGQGASDCAGQCAGGYNGGGLAISNAFRGSGGGATHIALQEDTLSELGYVNAVTNSKLLIVAGGGGGAGYYSNSYSGSGGSGGGLNGIDGQSYEATGSSVGVLGQGATQEAAGSGQTTGLFGQGANANNAQNGGAGGGGGFYGGGASSNAAGAGGGSGYIGGVTSYNSNNPQTISGDSSMPSPSGGTETGHSGNGAARITYMGN